MIALEFFYEYEIIIIVSKNDPNLKRVDNHQKYMKRPAIKSHTERVGLTFLVVFWFCYGVIFNLRWFSLDFFLCGTYRSALIKHQQFVCLSNASYNKISARRFNIKESNLMLIEIPKHSQLFWPPRPALGSS